MLGVQFDPTLCLSLSHLRHADLIADVHQQHLIRDALRYAARRPQPAARASRTGRTALLLTTLWRSLRLAELSSWSGSPRPEPTR